MSITKPNKLNNWRLRVGERRALVVFGDFLMGVLAFLIAIYYWAAAETISGLDAVYRFASIRLEWWFFLLPFLWLILLVDSYSTIRIDHLRRTLAAILVAALIGLFVYLIFYFATPPKSLPRRGVAMFILAVAILTMIWRILYIRIFTAPRFMHRALIMGAGVSGTALLEVINKLSPPPFYLLGLIDDDPDKIGTKIEGHPVIGNSERLLQIVEDHQVSDIIVCITGKLNPSAFQRLLEAQERGVVITRMPVAYEEMIGRVPILLLEADWILRSFVDQARTSSFYNIASRFIDLVAGLVGALSLIVLAPLIALAIYAEDGRPIIFEQTRAGRGGEPFRIMKFRSMRKDAEKDGVPQLAKENDDRATKVGRILRKTHLDEWLQFINVLRGEMSMVGPRPERPELVEEFQEEIPFYRARLLAKPGITGWAQIHFDYAATMEELVMKMEYDLYYIKHRTVWMDIVIILRTFAAVFGFRGR